MLPHSEAGPRLPLPPPDYREDKRLPLVDRPGPWTRIFRAARADGTPYDPLFFNTAPRNRFNAPDGEFGVLYAAEQLAGAFVETFGRHLDTFLITAADLDRFHVAVVTPSRPLRLVDLRGAHLRALGLSAEIWAGRDYERSRQWSRWFYGHPDQAAGILYPCRHNPEQLAIALFDRAASEVRADDGESLMSPRFATSVAKLMTEYGLALDDGPLSIV